MVAIKFNRILVVAVFVVLINSMFIYANTTEVKFDLSTDSNQIVNSSEEVKVNLENITTSEVVNNTKTSENIIKNELKSEVKSLKIEDFILKQEDLAYGVTLISKAVKFNIPFESNPILIKDDVEIKKVINRLFPDVKNLDTNLNAIVINLMTYKKDDKEHDFGLLVLEIKNVQEYKTNNIENNIKDSMLSYFKIENFYIIEKLPLVFVVAHNFPDGKKEDIKWVVDMINKKCE